MMLWHGAVPVHLYEQAVWRGLSEMHRSGVGNYNADDGMQHLGAGSFICTCFFGAPRTPRSNSDVF